MVFSFMQTQTFRCHHVLQAPASARQGREPENPAAVFVWGSSGFHSLLFNKISPLLLEGKVFGSTVVFETILFGAGGRWITQNGGNCFRRDRTREHSPGCVHQAPMLSCVSDLLSHSWHSSPMRWVWSRPILGMRKPRAVTDARSHGPPAGTGLGPHCAPTCKGCRN